MTKKETKRALDEMAEWKNKVKQSNAIRRHVMKKSKREMKLERLAAFAPVYFLEDFMAMMHQQKVAQKVTKKDFDLVLLTGALNIASSIIASHAEQKQKKHRAKFIKQVCASLESKLLTRPYRDQLSEDAH